MSDYPSAAPPEVLPHPRSLCHGCGAPPRYVRTKTSVFIQCPIAPMKYPPQPVARCDFFVPREPGDGASSVR
ncbi:MAG: hypothetical protein IPK07_22500 [Deltaproteobacteria bacterium]|nr:hypothetical protein [Deltaproteobacteria bacterium]